ncbi:hypothetical protein [Salipiger sp.]|uniref:hypothetical protein n=1 Tax=Salipiger sp. TaxID=2078585 RepID=UPI003A9838FF
MERKTGTPKSPAPARDQRLKAALKANLARRKAQAQARGQGKGAPQSSEKDT